MIRFSQSQNKLLIFTVLLGFALIGCNGSSEINQSSNPESEQINNTELNNEQGKKEGFN